MNALNILAVDDDDLMRQSLRMLLESEGHRVILVPDAATGISFFRKHEFDLAILDYSLPDMLGDALARIMKKVNPSVPLILLSVDPPAKQSPDFARVLLKPPSLHELRTVFRELVPHVVKA